MKLPKHTSTAGPIQHPRAQHGSVSELSRCSTNQVPDRVYNFTILESVTSVTYVTILGSLSYSTAAISNMLAIDITATAASVYQPVLARVSLNSDCGA